MSSSFLVGTGVQLPSPPPKIPSRLFSDGFLFLVERSRPPPPKAMAGQARLLFTLFASCRKAAIAKALHSKNEGFSSHLHKISEALLVKSFSDRACALRSSGSIRYRFTCEEVSSAARETVIMSKIRIHQL